MCTKTFFIAIMAMSLFAVQGYAQGARGHGGHHHSGHGGGHRTEKSYSGHSGSSSRGSYTTQHHGGVTRGGTNQGGNYNRQTPPPSTRQGYGSGHQSQSRGGSHHVAPPAPSHHGNHWRPTYHHHHNYHHHHHHCIFDSWSWYAWRGYSQRFIRHNVYNRYFDSMLGYYLWDSFDAPTRIDIGSMSFTRYQRSLKITIGNNISYLDLYQYYKVTYQVGTTYVQVIVDGGYANIYLYDEYGNSATYRL